MGALLLLHCGAMLCVLAIPLQWWAYLLIALVLLVSLIYYINKYVRFRLASSVVGLQQQTGRDWQLFTRKGTLITAKLGADSVVTRYVLILHFTQQEQKKHLSVIVFKDALSTNGFRQLRLLCLSKRG
jgi:hypothetical protein